MLTDGYYRDKYYEDYYDYLRERSDKERKSQGKKPYSESSIRTFATDTFYLEKRERTDFSEWLKDEESYENAYSRLVSHLYARKNPKSDAVYYLNLMKMFADFLKTKKGC